MISHYPYKYYTIVILVGYPLKSQEKTSGHSPALSGPSLWAGQARAWTPSGVEWKLMDFVMKFSGFQWV